MAEILPPDLYAEFLNDPTGLGYQIGNGVSFNDKQTMINEIRDTITVQRKSSDAPVGPGEVAEEIPVQLIRDSIDPDEYKLNCSPTSGDDEIAIGQKATTRDRISTFYGGSSGQSLFAFTDLSKAQILDLFTNALWPTTRANLVDLQTRDGSRAEELFGSPDAPVTRDDMLAAEAWGQANGQPSLYESSCAILSDNPTSVSLTYANIQNGTLGDGGDECSACTDLNGTVGCPVDAGNKCMFSYDHGTHVCGVQEPTEYVAESMITATTLANGNYGWRCQLQIDDERNGRALHTFEWDSGSRNPFAAATQRTLAHVSSSGPATCTNFPNVICRIN